MNIGKSTRHDEPKPISLPFNGPQDHRPMVLIRKEALHEMHGHAASEMHHEIAGYLLGFPAKDAQTGTNVTYIERAVRAIYDSTSTHVTMHAASFNDVETVRKQDGTILVGYYHSHPRLNIFLSSTDVENFKDYHSEDYQIAVVVDPSHTLSRCIESSLEWIGFFGWSKNADPVRLPAENIAFVERRPEIVAVAAEKADVKPVPSFEEETRVPLSERSLVAENEIALEGVEKIEQLSNMLRQGPHQFDSSFPIVIVSERIQELLLRNEPNLPREGLLIGEINRVAGYSLVSVIEIHPFELEGSRWDPGYIQKLLERFLNVPAQSYSLPMEPYSRGLRAVGFYCTGRRLSLGYRTFARYCEAQCLIAVTQTTAGKRTIDLKFGFDQNGKPVEVPESHIVIK